jgi:HD superfamily phosphohydrolase
MDYLLRDAYFTGVHYGTFDLDRILRVLRPHKGRIVVKESGMHAVEDYLMSRYQMYWQVYFHPVTRSSELLLYQIFRRARQLYEDGYRFAFMLPPLRRLLEGTMDVADYLMLDEAVMQATFGQWTLERDRLLADLCDRFLHRRLYKYSTLEEKDETWVEELRREWSRIGLDPDYHLAMDEPADSPYDVYRPDDGREGGGKPPILILDDRERLTEISAKSDIIRSIAGIQRGKFYLYYPAELVRPHAARLSPDVRERLGL